MHLMNMDSIRDYYYFEDLIHLLHGTQDMSGIEHLNTLQKQAEYVDKLAELKVE